VPDLISVFGKNNNAFRLTRTPSVENADFYLRGMGRKDISPFLPVRSSFADIKSAYLLATEDIDREGDYDDIEDKRAERLKNTGSPMNPRSDFHVGRLKGHRQTRRKIDKVPIVRLACFREVKASAVLAFRTSRVEQMGVV
jgi:hypothetical protein